MTDDKTKEIKCVQQVKEGHSGYFLLERRLEKNVKIMRLQTKGGNANKKDCC